ncbi:S-adenosyl-L-methionine-dependent methyltransferase [Glomus cerebriforme]|uniref:S-adenosyl-L-methionine-dependent methyltransferase n=1 Tax=Glomus cerebriforme TaxID=658196 RepID=A0A397SSP8_9GLOM|nr:S-adenosyl-L-methionine-dependent methyltransferase [Glomus cerebriforme]
MGFISMIKKKQNQRRLFKGVHYVLPVNSDEIDRTHQQHYVYREIWKKDFSAPVEDLLIKGARVLDIGCGPGTWTLELGTKYSNSKFKGIDAYRWYPTTIKPTNVSFDQANVLDGLPYEDDEFEYVIMRFMMFSFLLKEWKPIIKEMIRVCKPNGWIEIMEDDLVFLEGGPKTEMLIKTITKELKKKGVETIITPYIFTLLNSNSEITNVTSKKKVSQLGSLGNKQGELFLDSLKWGAKSLFESERLFKNDRNGILTIYNEIIDDFVNECNEHPTYFVSRRFYARKTLRVENTTTWRKFFRIKRFLKGIQGHRR